MNAGTGALLAHDERGRTPEGVEVPGACGWKRGRSTAVVWRP